MGRPRKTGSQLPSCVYLRHGAYYLVKAGKWTRLGSNLAEALQRYAELLEVPQPRQDDSMVALLRDAAPHILRGRAEETQRVYRHALAQLTQIFREFRVPQVTAAHLRRMMREMRDRPSAANRLLIVLSLVFRWAVFEELVDQDPTRDIDRWPTRARDRLLSWEEFQRIRAVADPRLQVLMDLAFLTGQRISDVIELEWSQVLDDDQVVELRQRKTGQRVSVRNESLPPVFAVARQLPHGDGLRVIPGSRGKALTYHVASHLWRQARDAAGVADATFHDIRAMAVTAARAQDLDAQALAGHRDAATTRIYLRDRAIIEARGPRPEAAKRRRS